MGNEKKLSLNPLKCSEAIADLLKVPSPKNKMPKAKKKKSPPKRAG